MPGRDQALGCLEGHPLALAGEGPAANVSITTMSATVRAEMPQRRLPLYHQPRTIIGANFLPLPRSCPLQRRRPCAPP